MAWQQKKTKRSPQVENLLWFDIGLNSVAELVELLWFEIFHALLDFPKGLMFATIMSQHVHPKNTNVDKPCLQSA
ncbi:hypothetical protein VCR31J2_590001 [Vibrio coralliirubri]|uniref:Uncharacterized protein n=1 Tax=Vibrio coralliirubri TaxID=1516159 RepID=A0AA86WTT1_9VIBR|nr:hypothetical protein VCR31J2_590001 [Vibrio coralliirubri]